MSFKPSKYQKAIFDFVRDGSGSAIIEAVAGSGKTTTIVKSLDLIPPDRSVLFLAFNKGIADELKSRVPRHVRAATFHSQGFAAWRKYVGKNLVVDPKKTQKLIREMMDPREEELYGPFVSRLVGLAKSVGMSYLMPDEPREWSELINYFNVYLDSEDAKEEEGIEMAQAVLEESIEKAPEVVDYDDMLFMPLLKEVTFWPHDFVFVDEAQDTNAVQAALLKRMLRPQGRLIAVGDPHQAIYGFRGADSNAMDNIADDFLCIRLPLSVSYRCPQAIVRAAREYVPHIEAYPGAPMGSVRDLGGQYKPDIFTKEDAILCRKNAPLVAMAYHLIGHGMPCKILGREIGKGLARLIGRMQAINLDQLLQKLLHYENRELKRCAERDQPEKAQEITDKVNSIMVLIENLPEDKQTLEGLLSEVERIFSDNGEGTLVLSTIHKAKGLEFPRVFILNRDLMPSKWARTPWQQRQEINLIYVAYTRAKEELNFITR
ncbi:MAG: ATP-dependent helicase [Thermodesulfobacteriota bacterium]